MTERTRRSFIAVTPVPGSRLTLDSEESHHVARVLRLRSGDALSVFDGKGGEWDATIDDPSREQVGILVGAARTDTVEPALRVALHQALVRPEKIEYVLQKGTEIGVHAFVLVVTERAEAPPPSPSRLARYERILMESCKQSGRRHLPSLKFGDLPPSAMGVLAIILAHAAGAKTLGSVLAESSPAEVWLAVGPEGGFSEDEIRAAEAKGWRMASLGPRVLRTETAGAVAAAIVLHALADLGPRSARMS